MQEWLRSTFPVLILRLMKIIILAHLNSDNYWSKIKNLREKSSVISELSQSVRQKIQVKPNCRIQRMMAEALDAIDDPLVVARPERSSELSDLNAIFVTPMTIKCREELLEVLFPQKERSDQSDHGCTNCVQATSSSSATIGTTECRSEHRLAITI